MNKYQELYQQQYAQEIQDNQTRQYLQDLEAPQEIREHLKDKRTEQLLSRNREYLRHPRTYETIIGIYGGTYKERIERHRKMKAHISIKGQKGWAGHNQPTVKYCSQTNRQDKSLKFKTIKGLRKFVKDAQEGKKIDKRIKLREVGTIRTSKQFKTVWYSRRDRRK